MSQLCAVANQVEHPVGWQVRRCHPGELTSGDLQVWRRLISEQFDLQSPFFHPEYIQAVGKYRQDVEVAVLEEAGAPVGFFPYQRCGRYSAMPVGGKLTDFQGLIGRLPARLTIVELLAECNLQGWSFDHLPASQADFAEGSLDDYDSPYLDLSQGWDAYVAKREAAGSRVVRETERKRRKLNREVGEMRFVPHSDDDEIFSTLLRWKSNQRRRTGTFDVLGLPWVVDVLEHIRRLKSSEMNGQVSALMAGDTLLAAHFGMGTPTIRHFWFAAYNPEYSHYSPGAILFLDLARHAAEQQVLRYDLGKGSDQFKLRVASDNLKVLEGGLDSSKLRHHVRHAIYLTRLGARCLPCRGLVRATKRVLDSFTYR